MSGIRIIYNKDVDIQCSKPSSIVESGVKHHKQNQTYYQILGSSRSGIDYLI
jgi:hypothetical protein